MDEKKHPYPEYEGLTLKELAEKMKEVRGKLDEIKVEKASFEKRHDFLRLNAIPDVMDDEDITNITLEEVGRVGLTSDVYASIPKPQRDKAWDWLRNNGHGGVITETVNSSTLKALAKDMISKGTPLPEEHFKITPFSRATITKV